MVAEAAQAAAGEPPEHLRTMLGVAQFLPQAEAEPVPEWVRPGEVERWRGVGAFRLWLTARREWCAAAGRDYVATFRPEWLERRR